MSDDPEQRMFRAVELLARAALQTDKDWRRRGYKVNMLDLLAPRGSTKVPSLQLRSKVAFLKHNVGEDSDDYKILKQVQDVLEGKDGSNT